MRNGVPAAIAALLLVSACGGGGGEEQQQAGPPQGPVPVSFVTMREQPVTLSTVLPGRTVAFETSDVRPQVNGLVQSRLFQEGESVRAGQALYRIDPAPYQAAVASARAALTRARAATGSTAALARRYGELVRINAIARQEYENALTGADQARADVAAQQAMLRTAEIDLARTTIRAPISGRIGRSVFTAGALVSAQQADPLATIQRLDPIYVDISQSSADLLDLRQRIMSGEVAREGDAARVRLRLENGTVYETEGRLRFTDVSVDPATGTQSIRAVFANPRGLLLPGMFVRAELIEGTKANGILVPQRAVSRDERGRATAMVVGQGNKVEPRQLTTSRTVGTDWLVTGGLKAGDRVIVEGGGMLMPGMAVTPQPYGQKPAQQGQGQGQGQPQGQAQGQAK